MTVFDTGRFSRLLSTNLQLMPLLTVRQLTAFRRSLRGSVLGASAMLADRLGRLLNRTLARLGAI